jgi:hypothetical protein
VVDPSIGDVAVANGGLEGLGSAPGSTYASGGLRADLVDKASPVKLDGVLDEWPARTLASTVIKGSGDKLTFSVAVQYDDARIYVGAEVADESFFRTAHFGEGEDHASLTIAFPQLSQAGSLSAYEIGLFAGKPGETAGQVRFVGSRHGEIPGAKIVEAPAGKGYTFEASIPWSTFPEARTLRVGLRGAARYYDSDGSGKARNIVATGQGDGASASSAAGLPALLTEPEESMLEGLLNPKNLSKTAPKVDIFADVVGDAMKERISVYDHFFTICGPGYRGGKEFFYRDLGADLVRLEARELTGRGKADLIVRRRFSDEVVKREWFEVWSLLGGDEPVTTFAHEIAIVKGPYHVDNTVHVAGKDIEVGYEPATGWDATSYKEPTASDVEPILLPWGTVRMQSFHYDGSRYKKAKEIAQAGVAPAPPPGEPKPPALPRDVPTPPQHAGGDLSSQLFDQYKRDHTVPSDAKPRFDLQVNVEGDGRAERVVLVGRDIVVFGPGFLGGTQYAFVTLQQFADAADIHELVARDLTGDGAADLVVRGVRHPAGTGHPIDVEGTFIYQVKGGSITRVFAIETAREQAGKRVQGMVQFIPNKDGHGFDIDVRPGRATGWTQKTFPWSQEQPGSGAIEPLLLPWGGIPSVRYSWNGTTFAKS